MTTARKVDLPTEQARCYLESGPIVLLTSAHRRRRDVMTLGWHMMLGYDRIGTYVWNENNSFDLLRLGRECVINLPTADMVDTVVRIGNCDGRHVDKFEYFGLPTKKASKVTPPLLADCHASFECVLADASQIKRHGLFIWNVVKAHVASSPRRPTTLHYRGGGEFML